jgi:peroxiredoxin Q/BCP
MTTFARLSPVRPFAARLSVLGLVLAALLAFAAPAPADDSPAVGTMAPDFKLLDQAGKSHSLAQYRGRWVVLYFYPKDGTPGCTTQACELRDNIFAFRQANAQILGVSVDDVDSKKKFAEEHKLPFPVLADDSKEVSKRYGVLTKFMGVMELSQRDTFLIDPQGRIAKHWVKVDPKGHSELVLAEIKAQQAKAAPAKAAALR